MEGRRLLEGWVSRNGQTATHKQVDCEDTPLLGTLVTGCPGRAWGNLAPHLCSCCGGHWGPQQMWSGLEPQQELMEAPVGLEDSSGSLEDKDTVMSGRNQEYSR